MVTTAATSQNSEPSLNPTSGNARLERMKKLYEDIFAIVHQPDLPESRYATWHEATKACRESLVEAEKHITWSFSEQQAKALRRFKVYFEERIAEFRTDEEMDKKTSCDYKLRHSQVSFFSKHEMVPIDNLIDFLSVVMKSEKAANEGKTKELRSKIWEVKNMFGRLREFRREEKVQPHKTYDF